MKKVLLLLGLLVVIGGVVGYAITSDSASKDISTDRYGTFETYDADDIGLIEYIIEYNRFNEELKTLDLTYGLMTSSDDKENQYNLASSYVEKYTEVMESMYEYNNKNKIPSEYKALHESLIKEIGIADLITDEFGDAIDNENFSKVDELMEKSQSHRKEGLTSTDRIEYFEDAGEFVLKN